MINRNSPLNKPIIVLGIMTYLAIGSTNINEFNYNKNKDYKQTSENVQSRYNFCENISLINKNMEENSCICKNVINFSNPYDNYSGNSNEKIILKNDIKDFIDDVDKMLGGMRYLSKEEQDEYNENINNLYKETESSIFDFI